MLRARREEPSDSLPEPIVVETEGDPEHEALMAESVGLALLVVLETLSPAERLAFVLHDMFAVPFSEIAAILGRSPDSARQLASRARRRVRGATPAAERDLARQREVVEAFLAASRAGDFERLVAVLDPDVEFRVDIGPAAERFASGAEAVAQRVLARGSRFAPFGRFAVVNGAPGVFVAAPGRRPNAVVGMTVVAGRIASIEVTADPSKLRGLRIRRSD
jgi:RNA polymerase sigma-70 factor (ECF subfamily)